MAVSQLFGRAGRVLKRDGLVGLLRAINRRATREVQRLRNVSKRDLLRGRRAVWVEGSVMELPDERAWAFADGTYYEKNVEYWFRQALHVKFRPVVFDIGANCGYYTLIAAAHAAAVYAFEPATSTHEVLLRNVARNKLDNVKSVRIAVGAEPGELPLTLYSSSGNNSLAVGPETLNDLDVQGFETVPVETLDRLLELGETRAPDVIKIDTEGGELGVLRGARRLLDSHRPLLIFEYSEEKARAAGYTLELIQAELEPHGYSLFGLSDPMADDRADIDLHPLTVRSIIGNLVAIPPAHPWRAVSNLAPLTMRATGTAP